MNLYTVQPYALMPGILPENNNVTYLGERCAGGTRVAVPNESGGTAFGELVESPVPRIERWSLGRPSKAGVVVRVPTQGVWDDNGPWAGPAPYPGFITAGHGWKTLVHGQWARTWEGGVVTGPDDLLVTQRPAIMEVVLPDKERALRYSRRYVFVARVLKTLVRVCMFDLGDDEDNTPQWDGLDPCKVIRMDDREMALQLLQEKTAGGTPRFLLPRTKGEDRASEVLRQHFKASP